MFHWSYIGIQLPAYPWFSSFSVYNADSFSLLMQLQFIEYFYSTLKFKYIPWRENLRKCVLHYIKEKWVKIQKMDMVKSRHSHSIMDFWSLTEKTSMYR